MTSLANDGRILLHSTPLAQVMVVEFRPVIDARGGFVRLFSSEYFLETGLFPNGPVHLNMSFTLQAGTVRGLHWQEPVPGQVGEAKLVLCVSGRIFDAVVDVRPESPSRGKSFAIELESDGHRGLLVPPGVAHGMQALEDGSRLLYVNSSPFYPDRERGLRPTDSMLDVKWPLPVANLSERDRSHPLLADRDA
jgi:dTDP-4-dehydrorhamnose 3,5-epimerase